MGRKKYRGYDYEAVVIGSGIGGLTAGAYLARKGRRVLICEQNHQPGGCFNSFTRKGYTFDGGIQGCEDAGMLFSMLRQLGIEDRLTLTRGKSAVATPDFFVPFPRYQELAQFYSRLESVYPQEVSGLRELNGELQRLCRFFDGVFHAPNPGFQGGLFRFGRDLVKWLVRYGLTMKEAPLFIRLCRYPFEEYLRTKFSDPRPAKMIAQTVYRGSPTGFALPFFYFFTQYFYPRGGVQRIPDLLASYITGQGGEIRYRTTVGEILYENGRAGGVRLESGEAVRAPFVISNGDWRNTFLRMLPAEAVPADFRRRLEESDLSESMFSVYLGVDIPPEKLPVQGCQHVLYLTSYDGVEYDDVATDPDYYRRSFIMMMIPSIEDPTLAPPGKSVVILQSAAVEEFADRWGTADGKRTERYRQVKEEVADRLIANAEKIIPGLKEKIELKVTASPLTFHRYTLNSGGATGGWSKHPARTFSANLKGLMHVTSPVKNLYLAGHWTSIPGGAPMGMMSGRLAAGLVNFRLRWGW